MMAAVLDDVVLEHKSMSVLSTEKAFRRAGIHTVTAKGKWLGVPEATACLRKRGLSPICIKVGCRPIAALSVIHVWTEGRRGLLVASGKTFFFSDSKEQLPIFSLPGCCHYVDKVSGIVAATALPA